MVEEILNKWRERIEDRGSGLIDRNAVPLVRRRQ